MVRPNKKITKRNANVPPAARNTQDNTRGIIPGLTAGTTYGEGQDIKEQVQATGGLPDASLATSTAQPRPSKSMPQMDVFAGTQRPTEPVTSGLPFGPGVNPQPEEQIYQAENIRDFIYQTWVQTGDDSLLEYL